MESATLESLAHTAFEFRFANFEVHGSGSFSKLNPANALPANVGVGPRLARIQWT